MFATTTATALNIPTPKPSPRARGVAEDACGRRWGRSHYEVLRVKHDASPVEIKAAYRTLAKLYHPDAKSRFEAAYSGGDSTDGHDFIQIREAYGTLSDPDARAVYDCALSGSRPWSYEPGSGHGVGIYTTRRWETDQCW